eukprot:TRINITY_DN4610_c0_g1_i1.p1 TRINITY_DN4610_c0_g1~~TRINITY_DN4610_c0_g1_i1.p1  ORF type:complete len:152 (-),score=20.62 TRINITY_DN4610_c0_g1_i1:91-546(-)
MTIGEVLLSKPGFFAKLPAAFEDKVKQDDFTKFQEDINRLDGPRTPAYILSFGILAILFFVGSSAYSAHHWIFVRTIGDLKYQIISWGSWAIAGAFAAAFIGLNARHSSKMKAKVARLCRSMEMKYPSIRWEMKGRTLHLSHSLVNPVSPL